MQAEDDSLEVLGRSECLEFLAASSVGRVVFTDRRLPVVLSVTFLLEDDTVVFRTDVGSRLATRTNGAVCQWPIRGPRWWPSKVALRHRTW